MLNGSFFLLLNPHILNGGTQPLTVIAYISLFFKPAPWFSHIPVVHTFIISHPVYCNSLFSGLWMSTKYTVVFTKHRLDHATLLFKELQGFPITYKIKPKTFSLVCMKLRTACLQTPFQPYLLTLPDVLPPDATSPLPFYMLFFLPGKSFPIFSFSKMPSHISRYR